jgi:hypothetical protein
MIDSFFFFVKFFSIYRVPTGYPDSPPNYVGTGRVGDYNYRYFMCSHTGVGVRKETTRKEGCDEEGRMPIAILLYPRITQKVHLGGGTTITILETLRITSAVKRAGSLLD